MSAVFPSVSHKVTYSQVSWVGMFTGTPTLSSLTVLSHPGSPLSHTQFLNYLPRISLWSMSCGAGVLGMKSAWFCSSEISQHLLSVSAGDEFWRHGALSYSFFFLGFKDASAALWPVWLPMWVSSPVSLWLPCVLCSLSLRVSRVSACWYHAYNLSQFGSLTVASARSLYVCFYFAADLENGVTVISSATLPPLATPLPPQPRSLP